MDEEIDPAPFEEETDESKVLINRLEQQSKQLQHEIETWKKRYSSLETNFSQYRARAEKEKNDSLQELTTQFEAARGRIVELEVSLSDHENELFSLGAVRKALEEELNAVRTENANLKASKKDTEKVLLRFCCP
jgi:chromosome segregation ATPase